MKSWEQISYTNVRAWTVVFHITQDPQTFLNNWKQKKKSNIVFAGQHRKKDSDIKPVKGHNTIYRLYFISREYTLI